MLNDPRSSDAVSGRVRGSAATFTMREMGSAGSDSAVVARVGNDEDVAARSDAGHRLFVELASRRRRAGQRVTGVEVDDECARSAPLVPAPRRRRSVVSATCTGARAMAMKPDADQVRRTAERYFAALQRFDLDEVTTCFTPDVFYSHPPYDPSRVLREEVRGRENLAEMLRTKRGDRPIVQVITACVVHEDLCFLEGIVKDKDGATVGSFVSSARVTDDALFSSYIAYGSAPAAGAALP
jgi:ketosteroid isomerase-like protein